MYPAYAESEVATDATSNYASTRDTILLMQQLVTESVGTPQVAQAASEIAAKLGRSVASAANIEEIARRVFWWTKSNVRLVEDEWTLVDHLGHDKNELLLGNGKELLISPAYLLLQDKSMRQGDCDDFSMLAATLLIRLGVPRANIRFTTIASDGLAPENFTHVYVKVQREDGAYIPLDCSHGSYPGWETKEVYNEMLWPV